MDRAEAKNKTGSRKKISAIVSVVITLLACVVAADGLGSNGLVQPLGYVWLDFMDMWSEGIMMPLGALFMCVFIGYEYTTDELGEEIAQEGNIFKSKKFYSVCVRFVAPIAMFFILFGQLQSFGILK